MSIRVGIIGLHQGVTVHLPAYAASAKYEIVAVCDRAPGLAEEVARTHHVPYQYTDAAQLIAAPEVEVVSIATPPRTHVGLATAALKAGKHVVVETPFVCNLAEVRALKAQHAALIAPFGRDGHGELHTQRRDFFQLALIGAHHARFG